MKKSIILTFVLALFSCVSYAQLVKQKTANTSTDQSTRDWYNCSFDKDGVYGARVNEAYDFLKGKKVKYCPIVALIGTGVDIEHEALKENIWKNRKEKPDGKDNDKDGYIDDVNGWNFIGGKDGQVMPYVMREGDREFLRLKEKYGDILKDGDKFYSFSCGEMKECPAPDNLAEFDYFTKVVAKESRLYEKYRSRWTAKLQEHYVKLFDQEVRAKYLNMENIPLDSVVVCCAPKSKEDNSMRGTMAYAVALTGVYNRTKEWNKVYDLFTNGKQYNSAIQTYEKQFSLYGNDGRKEIVKDDYLEIKDNIYGNNVLLTVDAAIGTMIAGVIAGSRGIEGRNNPIAEQAEIMPLVVQAGDGEPYLKDMALAIRYAVDHDASIIVLPQQNSFYPEGQKQWMTNAIRYAEEKGVLVIVPVHEISRDLSEHIFYPNRWMDNNHEFTNLMTVGVSESNGLPSIASNFGAKELDIFAPGNQIFSTGMGDTYQMGSGMAMASATLAGVAALIKTYYPKLTGSQIRDILLQTVTSRKGIEIEKNVQKGQKIIIDLYVMEQLCLSAGIVNALDAVKVADELCK